MLLFCFKTLLCKLTELKSGKYFVITKSFYDSSRRSNNRRNIELISEQKALGAWFVKYCNHYIGNYIYMRGELWKIL